MEKIVTMQGTNFNVVTSFLCERSAKMIGKYLQQHESVSLLNVDFTTMPQRFRDITSSTLFQRCVKYIFIYCENVAKYSLFNVPQHSCNIACHRVIRNIKGFTF